MASRFWVGGTGTWDAADTTHWSATSGGAGGASVPTSSDNVFFNASSGGGTATIGSGVNVFSLSLDFTGYTGTLSHPNSSNLFVYDSLTMSSGMTYAPSNVSGTQIYLFSSTGTHTITTNGIRLSKLYIGTTGGGGSATYNMQSALSIGNLSINSGTFNTNNYGVTLSGDTGFSQFISTGSTGGSMATVNLGTSTINVIASGFGGAATVGLNSSGSRTVNVNGSSATFNLSIGGSGGPQSQFYVSSSGYIGTVNVNSTAQPLSFSNFADTKITNFNLNNAGNASGVQFKSGSTTSISNWTNNGSAGSANTITSLTPGSQATVVNTGSGSFTLNYVNVKDINASGAWVKGTGFVDSGNNQGFATLMTKTQSVTANISPQIPLTDTFDSNSLSSNWTPEGTVAEIVNQNQRIEISHTAVSEYNTLATTTTYNLTGRNASVQLVDAGNQSLVSHEAIYGMRLDASNSIWITVTGGTIRPYKKVAGTRTGIVPAITYSPTNHKWLRIRETAGTTYFETSANRVTWNVLASTANPFSMTSVSPYMQAGNYNNEATGSYAYFDNFNTAPTVSYTQTVKAAIAKKLTTTQTSISRVAIKPTKQQSAKARIGAANTQIQQMTARIANVKSMLQTSGARVSQTYTLQTSTIARIANTPTKTQPAKATLQMTAHAYQTAKAALVDSEEILKRYDYKVYDGSTYLGLLPSVTSEYSHAHEINTVGSQISIVVAQSSDISGYSAYQNVQDEAGDNIQDENSDPILSEGYPGIIGIEGGASKLIKTGNRVKVIEYSSYYPMGKTMIC